MSTKFLTILLFCTSVLAARSYAQYQVVGNASAITANTFQLTPDVPWQSGAIWHKLRHDFTSPFSITGNLFFGDNDDGADGIVFVIQNKCLVTGTAAGGGMGYQNFPGYSLGIEFDTYQNAGAPTNDPAYDHMAILRDGSINHGTNLAGPVQIDATAANVEDNTWHSFQITYDPATTTLRVYFAGNLRLSYNIDIANNILHGEDVGYWGFTSATGGTHADNRVSVTAATALALEDTTVCNNAYSVTLPPLNAVNAAFNHTATASSVEGGYNAANAFDNNMNTRWSSNFSNPQWITVDLGTATTIDSVILYWEGAYGSEYIIQTSPDNASWTDRYHEYTGNGGTDRIYFTAANVRYVRMYGLQRGTGYGFSLWEFEVYSTPRYSWTPNDGTIDDPTSATPTFTPTTTTTYSVSVPDACLGQTILSFTITVCSVLPVELLSFNGLLNDRQIDLIWATANETNNDYFIVERSGDAGNWQTVGQVDGAGTHSGQLNYTLIDENIDWAVPGYYYRLTQVDFDGNASVSDIVFIPLNPNFGNELLIFPNPAPADQQIHITGIDTESDPVAIYDVTGKSVLQSVSVTTVSKHRLLIDVAQLATGHYTVRCGEQLGEFIK